MKTITALLCLCLLGAAALTVSAQEESRPAGRSLKLFSPYFYTAAKGLIGFSKTFQIRTSFDVPADGTKIRIFGDGDAELWASCDNLATNVALYYNVTKNTTPWLCNTNYDFRRDIGISTCNILISGGGYDSTAFSWLVGADGRVLEVGPAFITQYLNAAGQPICQVVGTINYTGNNLLTVLGSAWSNLFSGLFTAAPGAAVGKKLVKP